MEQALVEMYDIVVRRNPGEAEFIKHQWYRW